MIPMRCFGIMCARNMRVGATGRFISHWAHMIYEAGIRLAGAGFPSRLRLAPESAQKL